MKEKKHLRICETCGKEEWFDRKRTGNCRPCAAKKLGEDRRDKTKTTCPECGEKKSYSSKTCQKCSVKWGEDNPMFGKSNKPSSEAVALRSGENHWNWKGGTTKDRSGKQVAWSKAVKDNYQNTCDCCGYDRNYALEAHHYEFSEGKRHNDFDVNNGVALCSNCHKEFHKKYGWGNNNQDQYREFKKEYNKESEVA